jgi:hypothetical protein
MVFWVRFIIFLETGVEWKKPQKSQLANWNVGTHDSTLKQPKKNNLLTMEFGQKKLKLKLRNKRKINKS